MTVPLLHADGLSGPLEPFALDAVATSSPDGNFTIAEVAPGRLRVLVEADGWALAESREVFLIEDEKLTDLDVDLAPSGTLSISVLDPQGDPVRADVVLSGGELRARRKRTSQDGKLILSGIPVGEVRLDATSDGFENEQVIAKLLFQFLNPLCDCLFFHGQRGVHEVHRTHRKGDCHGSHPTQGSILFEGTDGRERSKRRPQWMVHGL